MSKNTSILVTGGAGYIGSVLVRILLNAGHHVRVLDSLRSGGDSLVDILGHPQFEFIKGDIRDASTVQTAVAGCDAIAHLAAIVGDPACKKEPDLAKDINLNGGKLLWEAANAAGCKRFVFASTCSNYGKMDDPNQHVVETSELRPLSVYSETKVEFEQFLLGQPKSSVTKPTCLRFSTVYGLSPRPRFDLTVNEFAREIALGKELVIFGQQFWRPYCHVDDLSRSVLAVIEAEESKVAFDVFNVGDTSENWTKQMIVDELLRQIPSGKVKYVPQGTDLRDYRVGFEKIRDRLGFTITKRVPDGIRETRRVFELGLLSDPYDPSYSNI